MSACRSDSGSIGSIGPHLAMPAPCLYWPGAGPVRLPGPALIAEVPKPAAHDDERVMPSPACQAAAGTPILEANGLLLPRERIIGRLTTLNLPPASCAAMEFNCAVGDPTENGRHGTQVCSLTFSEFIATYRVWRLTPAAAATRATGTRRPFGYVGNGCNFRSRAANGTCRNP
jgi:hypothetical protein